MPRNSNHYFLVLDIVVVVATRVVATRVVATRVVGGVGLLVLVAWETMAPALVEGLL